MDIVDILDIAWTTRMSLGHRGYRLGIVDIAWTSSTSLGHRIHRLDIADIEKVQGSPISAYEKECYTSLKFEIAHKKAMQISKNHCQKT